MISSFNRLLFITSLWLTVASGQRGVPSGEEQQRLPVVSFEAIPFFTEDTAQSFVNIHYRIPEEFFVVQRSTETLRLSDFVAKGELLIELRDSRGNSTAREIRSIILRSSEAQGERTKSSDLQGAFSLKVLPGTYSIWFTIDDQQSERTFTNKNQTVTTRGHQTSALDLSAPVLCFASADSVGNPLYEALNHGTDVFFGEKGGFLFHLFAPVAIDDLSVRFVIKNQPDMKGLELQQFDGGSLVLHPGIVKLAPRSEDAMLALREPVRYVIAPAERGWQSVFVPLPLEKLQPGQTRISMEFQFGESKKSFDRTFRVLWPDRPRSLMDIDLAVDALQHIASENEMAAFRTFSDTRSVRALFDFWRKKDPDTLTAYNGIMAEYYRRVDVANQQFSSQRSPDGYKSDRGRIYILYGAPANTERLFSPHHPPREIWTYGSLQRRFVFEDQAKNGVYVLVAAEEF